MQQSNRSNPRSNWRDPPPPIKKRRLDDERWRSQHKIPRDTLPIHSRRSDIMNTLAVNQVLIVQGDTGCGKTTQIPQFILEDFPQSRIVVTQPRRLAALGVAKRVCEELGSRLGETVGYHIKGEKLYGDHSRVVFMTTGMFIQELVGSKEFPWSHVIVDEVHERAVETEFLLVILKHILAKSEAKLILMSATIDTNLFANYYADSEIRAVSSSLPWFVLSDQVKFDTTVNSFEEIPIVQTEPEESKEIFYDNFIEEEKKNNSLQFQPKIAQLKNPYEIDREDAAPIKLAGPRNYTVQEIYMEEIRDWLRDFQELDWNEIFGLYTLEIASIDNRLYQIAAQLIRYQHTHLIFDEETPQTFLIFLPGIHEIHRMQDTILEQMHDLAECLEICLLHSSIPEELHGRIFSSPIGKRRIILSTNIAESSITLPDVRYIIDFCNVKELMHNSRTNTEMLELQWASKATMKQRAGRAGRVAEGVTFRLLPREFYGSLSDYSKPEIQRCPLDKLILKIKQLNLGTPKEILGRALQPPDLQDIEFAEKFLIEMGALNREEQLTWLGKVYADMPCDIKISRLCLFGYIFGCMHESLIMAAALAQEKSPFLSLASLPYRYAKDESKAYAQRLIWDGNRDSDPISYLTAYTAWFNNFGHDVKHSMKHSKRFIGKVPATEKEKVWARNNFIDHNVMREILLTYEEIKRRFIMMNLSSHHLKQKNSLNDPDTVFRMKLCLAAAFIGKYCQSHFAYEDEVKRRKKEHFLKERAKNTIIIPKIPDFVNEQDVKYVLRECRTDELTVDLHDGTAYVSFGFKFKDKRNEYVALQMAIWLGSYSARFSCGDFTIVKKTIRDPETNDLIHTSNVSNPDYYIQQVPRVRRKEGLIQALDSTITDQGSEQIEICWLHRPEFLYCLGYTNLMNHNAIHIEESSVCYITIERDTLFEKQHILVCPDFFEKRYKTYSKNVTLLPKLPLIAEILMLIFTRQVSFKEQNGRYEGFDAGITKFKLLHSFSGKDVEDINEIRKEISEALFNELGISDTRLLQVYEKVKTILFKKRLANVELNEVPYQPPVHFIKIVSISSIINQDHYLAPLQPLQIPEDQRLWSEEGQALLEAELLNRRADKERIVIELQTRAKLMMMNNAELVCKECSSTICAWNNVSPVEISPVDGIFSITGIYATVKHDNTQGDSELELPVVNFVISNRIEVEYWARCLDGHIIGWKTQNKTYVCHLSTLELALPNESMDKIPWNASVNVM